MVMEAVEHDEKNADSRWVSDQSLIGECVGFQLSTLESSDRVLLFLSVSIQGCQVEVGGRVVLVLVIPIGPEQV